MTPLVRAARLAALGVVAVVALAGCVRITSDTQVHADDTFSQTAIIATTERARQQLGTMANFDLGDLMGSIKSSEQYLAIAAEYPGQIEVEDFADGDLSGVQITATDLPLEAFEGTFAQFTAQLPFTAKATLVHTEDTYVVSIPSGALGDLLSEQGVNAGQLELLGSSVDIRLMFSFPGLVTSATAGEIDGKSVTLNLADLATGEDITIVAGAAEEMNWKPWLMWGGIGLAALVIIGGATALVVQDVRRHRHNTLPQPDAGAGQGASGPGVLIIPEEAPPTQPTTEATDDEKPL
ncbi:LppM family (lipo)protein [Demequina sp.]|uniref:LppM family (lipo)protein n=1 Tax=Demequina sp. TaxID=2050685 RepID=UPI003D119F59